MTEVSLPILWFVVGLNRRLPSQVEAVGKESQQLVRGAKAQLASGVDLLDEAFEVSFHGIRRGAQLDHECAPHHMTTLRPRKPDRCESLVQLFVKVRSAPSCCAGSERSATGNRQNEVETERCNKLVYRFCRGA